jgi:hypothetical protein
LETLIFELSGAGTRIDIGGVNCVDILHWISKVYNFRFEQTGLASLVERFDTRKQPYKKSLEFSITDEQVVDELLHT